MLTGAGRVAGLGTFGRYDLDVAGGKGANLGELLRAGVWVPDGFVVTTTCYAEAMRSLGLDPNTTDASRPAEPGGSASLRDAIEAMTVPPDLAAEIIGAYRDLGEGPVAVRSSATAEDLPGAAFAGQQETFLNVVGPEQLLRAVRGCWASLRSDRAVAYRARLGVTEAPQIAVVVQRMVPAEFAGVLFTANPVTGARDQIVIELSPGLGEAVVSGQVTPEHVVLDQHGHVQQRRAGRAEVVIRSRTGGGVVSESEPHHELLQARVLTALTREGVRIGRHFGRPQDIEWAHADGRTWILQARPLTALPPAPVKTNRVQREAAVVCAELLPTRPYPLDLTAWTVPGWFKILARMVAEVPAIDIDVARMFPAVDGVMTELLPPRPRPTWRTLTAPLRLRARRRRFNPADWTADPRFVDYEDQVERLRRRNPTAMTWAELMQVPAQVLGLLDDFVDVRIDYLPAVVVNVIRLRALLALHGLSSQFWPLLAGQPTQTRAANDRLHTLGKEIRQNQQWARAFQDLDDVELLRTIADADAFRSLCHAVQSWTDDFGHRETTSAALLSSATWADNPHLLLASLRGLVARPAPVRDDPDRAEAAIRTTLRLRRVRLTRAGGRIAAAAEAARTAMVFREDSHFHALRVRPILRSALLEAGLRLTRAGVLGAREDVLHLELDELRALGDPDDLGDGERARLQDLVRRRTLRRAEFGQAPLISPATLFAGPRPRAADALVSGAPGGGGRAAGPVRIVREPSEFGSLRPGEVLVCPYTNPAWTPLFEVAVAVVADSGSFGSHAAIVAREYGIPAVMGTGNGTRLLTDGLVVEVDGDHGSVVAAPPDPHDD